MKSSLIRLLIIGSVAVIGFYYFFMNDTPQVSANKKGNFSAGKAGRKRARNQKGPPKQANNPGASQGVNGAGQPGAKPEKKEESTISQIRRLLAPFIYNRSGLTDPFETRSAQQGLVAGKIYGPFLKNQNYRLSSFKLVGLLWGIDDPVALFSRNNKVVRLGLKDYIGENFGYIASIREKEVVIVQTIEENGRRYSSTKVLFLENQ